MWEVRAVKWSVLVSDTSAPSGRDEKQVSVENRAISDNVAELR